MVLPKIEIYRSARRCSRLKIVISRIFVTVFLSASIASRFYISIFFFRNHLTSNKFWILLFKLILNLGLRNISCEFKIILNCSIQKCIRSTYSNKFWKKQFESFLSSKLFWFHSCFKIHLNQFLVQNLFVPILSSKFIS